MINASPLGQLLVLAACTSVVVPAMCCTGQLGEPWSPGASKQRDSDLVKLEVLMDVDRVQPHKTFHLVLLFDIADAWHLYWKNPGAGAAPIEVSVRVPHDLHAGEVRWPRPKVITGDTGVMYGYEKQVALFVPITASEHFTAEAALIHYDVAWAACDVKKCVMQSKQGSIPVTASSLPPVRERIDRRPLIEKHRKRLPASAADDEDVTVQFDGETLTVSGPAHGFEEATLLPHPTPGVTFAKSDIDIEGDRFVLTVTITTQPRNFAGTNPLARGLIGLGEEISDPSYEFSVPLGP